MRIGVLTGGGDCPGLNAVIRALVRRAEREYGHELIGFRHGWRGVTRGAAGRCKLAAQRSDGGLLHRHALGQHLANQPGVHLVRVDADVDQQATEVGRSERRPRPLTVPMAPFGGKPEEAHHWAD